MSPIQDYSDNDSLCYSVSVADENDFSSDLFFETANDTKKMVVIFGDGFHPRQQQHDNMKGPQNDTSKRRKVKKSSSARPSTTIQYPKATAPSSAFARMQPAISLK
jgi:hypothetical protein